jgi:hypothetical protein
MLWERPGHHLDPQRADVRGGGKRSPSFGMPPVIADHNQKLRWNPYITTNYVKEILLNLYFTCQKYHFEVDIGFVGSCTLQHIAKKKQNKGVF